MGAEGQYPAQTCAERKEALYKDIIDLFSKGKVLYHYSYAENDERPFLYSHTSDPICTYSISYSSLHSLTVVKELVSRNITCIPFKSSKLH